MIECAADAVVAVDVGRIGAPDLRVADLDTVARIPVVADDVVWDMSACARLRVA